MSGGSIFVIAAVHLVLTAMPGVAAALLAVRQGIHQVPLLLCIALAASGAAAVLTFWIYFGVPSLGGFCAYAVFFGSVALAVWSWPEASRQRELLRRLSTPLWLWALGSLFLIFFGFLHGGAEKAVETASFRFATEPTPFATDSSIPLFFSDWIFAGSPGSVPVFPPEWQLSDRPPLQIGYVLTQRVFGWDEIGLHYEALGVILQQLWIVGLWAVLLAARVSDRTRALAMVAALVSDIAIVNGFYVWPKLLGSAFVLAALALVIAPRGPTLRLAPVAMVLLGVFAGLAFLAHGTSVFGLVPVAVLALWRGLPSWRWLAVAAVALLILAVPWMAYQQQGDPPGNRLAKWSLAGVVEIDNRGVVETLLDEYGKAGLGGTLENKLENFHTMIGGNPSVGEPKEGQFPFGDALTEIGDTASAVVDGRFDDAASKVREIRHWHLLWTLGILLLALPLIVVGRLRGDWRDDADWRFARLALLVCGIGVLAWGLLMFGSLAGRTVVTQGTLALPLIAIAGVAAALRATYPRWADWLVAASVLTNLVVYLPTLAPVPDSDYYSAFAIVAAGAGLAGFLLLAFSSRSAEQPPALAED